MIKWIVEPHPYFLHSQVIGMVYLARQVCGEGGNLFTGTFSRVVRETHKFPFLAKTVCWVRQAAALVTLLTSLSETLEGREA